MLFSAGTFLYVATVHVLQDISHMHTSNGSHCSQTSEPNMSATGQLSDISIPVSSEESSHSKHSDHLNRVELAALVTGIISPMLFQLQHTH